ncbi:ACT domain-containing protein [Rhizobium leguminosarum]|uniref:ACT domain-containing protein n=1 Tax=Rhizobium leguminosarum TaxID=384 RepID=UPI003CCAF5F9
MTTVLRDKFEMLSNMTPSLIDGEYVFCSIPYDGSKVHDLNPIATFQEREGLTLVLEKGEAHEAGFETSLAMRQITLNVNSALDGVGLTAGSLPVSQTRAFRATWWQHITTTTFLCRRA